MLRAKRFLFLACAATLTLALGAGEALAGNRGGPGARSGGSRKTVTRTEWRPLQGVRSEYVTDVIVTE